METSTIIRVIIMAIGAIIAIVGMNKSKAGAVWGQPLAICGAILAIIAALWGIKRTIAGDDMKEARNRELEYQRIQTRELGKYLSEKFAGSKVLIIVDPMLRFDTWGAPITREDPILEGLKQGLGSNLTITAEVFPKMPVREKPAPIAGPDGQMIDPIDHMMEPMEMWFTADKLKEILPAKDSYDILISLVGLPSQGNVAAVMRDLAGKKLVLVGGDTMMMGRMFAAGEKAAAVGPVMAAAVTYNPKAIYDDKPIPRDPKEAFDKRYLLITPENFASVKSEHGNLFSF
ncbi:MAG: hypothetical protein GX946_10245 [Oligosphaeraceae bacterium]|nr:hypothetical protein [Oligosphaeraceae bacterium]